MKCRIFQRKKNRKRELLNLHRKEPTKNKIGTIIILLIFFFFQFYYKNKNHNCKLLGHLLK